MPFRTLKERWPLVKYFEPVWKSPQDGILKNVVSRIALEHSLIAPTLKMNTLGYECT